MTSSWESLPQLIVGLAIHSFEGIVTPFDGQVCIEDEDSICGGIEQRIEALLFVGDLSVEPGVEDRDRGLVCKGLEQNTVIGCEEIGIIAKDEDHADDLSMRGEGQGRAVEQAHAGGVGQFLQHAVELIHIQLPDIFFGQQGGEVTEKGGSNPMGGRDAPAIFFESNNPGLPREHFNRDPQNARQQFLKIEFLGEGAGYFEQVITLSDAEIWKHMEFRAILSP